MSAVAAWSDSFILIWWYLEYASRNHNESCPAVASMIWSILGRGKGSLGHALLRSLKLTQSRQDLSFLGTITRFANHSGCLILRMNPAFGSFASYSSMACRLGSENRHRVCFTSLKPFKMSRLCSSSLREIPRISEGCQANISQFSHRNVLSASSIAGSSYAPMDVVLLGSVGCT